MRVCKIFVMILIFAFMLWGCGGGSKEEANEGKETNVTQPASLEEVRTAFKNFLENSTEENYQAFINAVERLTGDGPEENFFRGVGVLAKAYQDNKHLLKKYFGIDSIDDLKEMDEEELFEHFLSVENPNYNEDLDVLCSDLEQKLKLSYYYFERAEFGIGEERIRIDLGEEAPYFDKYDFKILKAIVKFIEAINYLGQAIDFGENINWNVTVNGQTVDLRELIKSGTEISEDIWREFLEKNYNLFNWKDKSKLSEFKQAMQELRDLVVELKDSFNVMDIDTLISRKENIFDIWTPKDVVELEGMANFLDSLVNAFDDRNASIIDFSKNETAGGVQAVQYGGKWFKADIYDYYKIIYSPSDDQEITIYDLVNGDKSLRDLLLYLYEEGAFYNNTSDELWKEEVYDLIEELDTYEIPLANISIDGNAGDWENVPVFREYSDLGIKIKIARDGQDYFYMYLEYEGIERTYFHISLYDYYSGSEYKIIFEGDEEECWCDCWYVYNNLDNVWENDVWEEGYCEEVKDSSGNIIGVEVKLPHISDITTPSAINTIYVYKAVYEGDNYQDHYEELKLLPVFNEE